MSITHNQSVSVNVDGSGPLIGRQLEVGNSNVFATGTFSAGAAGVPVTAAFAFANLQSCILVADQNMTVATNSPGVSSVQTLTATGPPTAGTSTAAFGGQTATGLAWNITAAALQTALQALSSIGAGNVLCTGGPQPGTPIVITFAGTLANAPQATITTSSSGLTGGTVAIASTTTGVAWGNSFALLAGSGLYWSRSQGYFPNPFTANVTALYVTSATANRLRGYFLTT